MPTVERDLRGQEYISVNAELPDKDFYPIAHAIWKALDDNGIILDDNAELSIRVYGVDTPEKGWRAECPAEAKWGEQASQFTKDQLNNAKKIQVAIYKWDKFGGRVLGDIVIDGKSLRAMLIENGFAREYFGDKKEPWC